MNSKNALRIRFFSHLWVYYAILFSMSIYFLDFFLKRSMLWTKNTFMNYVKEIIYPLLN